MGGLIKKEKNLKFKFTEIKFKLVMQSLQQKSW